MVYAAPVFIGGQRFIEYPALSRGMRFAPHGVLLNVWPGIARLGVVHNFTWGYKRPPLLRPFFIILGGGVLQIYGTFTDHFDRCWLPGMPGRRLWYRRPLPQKGR